MGQAHGHCECLPVQAAYQAAEAAQLLVGGGDALIGQEADSVVSALVSEHRTPASVVRGA
jgi:hypothetical protein